MSPFELKRCPACHTVGKWRPSHARGFIELQILSRLGFRPLRCGACRRRLVVFGRRWPSFTEPARSEHRTPSKTAPAGAPPQDDEDFRQLVAALRRSEETMEDGEPR